MKSRNYSKSLIPIYFSIEDDEGRTETREIKNDELEEGISYSMKPPPKSLDFDEDAENMGLGTRAKVRNPRKQPMRRRKKTTFVLPEVISVDGDDDDEELQRAIQLSKAEAGKDDEEPLIKFDEYDDDEELHRAIQLSKAAAGKDDEELLIKFDDDEELQKALLFSMESFPATSDWDEHWTVFGDTRLDLDEDWISFDATRSDMRDLKMKGVCHPPETKPHVELSNKNYHMGEASTSVCVVCTDEQPTGKMTRLSHCRHFFCNNCTGDYLCRAIQGNIHELRCPETKCNAILNADQYFPHLPTEVEERWSKALKEANALKDLADNWPLLTGNRIIFSNVRTVRWCNIRWNASPTITELEKED